jgi:hypothetical protein
MQDPRVGYQAKPFISYDQQCQELFNARLANKPMCVRYRLPHPPSMEDIKVEVSAYLGKVAFDHGWSDYYLPVDSDAPAILAPPPPPVKKNVTKRVEVVAGAKTLVEMFGPNGVVPALQAESRAATCADCPLHEKGDWSSLFTIPAALAVKRMIGIIQGAKLETTRDDALRVCVACGCPVRTKVWAKLDHILKNMGEEAKKDLPPSCWIKTESDNELLL